MLSIKRLEQNLWLWFSLACVDVCAILGYLFYDLFTHNLPNFDALIISAMFIWACFKCAGRLLKSIERRD